ncbi:STM4015 family protein [Yinghuangia soli]|uniref:STM4015 family protein n=1 Tax=Yinghuangia soli TaxID=2908204 RepID=A0AA41PU85_9ACTN|nr:STM4015 family protein [Yinghuangia soli]MCF2525682.1 STM4015 family protein [Yinghuangia soli]
MTSSGPQFGGLPIVGFPPRGKRTYRDHLSVDADPEALPAAGAVAWKLHVLDKYAATEHEQFPDYFARFLDTVDTARVTALSIGTWGHDDGTSAETVVTLLCAAADRFPRLTHLFFGDIVSEEQEISWIRLADLTPLLNRFTRLEELAVRGGGARLGPVRHERLRRLRFESGGLPGDVVRGIGLGEYPALEHLELWLGVDEYGGDATVDDLAGILAGTGLPALRHLGLMNSIIQDEIAEAIAGAAVTARLDVLDLSMGVLGDQGAEALLTGQPLGHLTKLWIHHHFIGERMAERLKASLGSSGVVVDMSEAEEPWDDDEDEDGRYVEVSE